MALSTDVVYNSFCHEGKLHFAKDLSCIYWDDYAITLLYACVLFYNLNEL